jgi:hypothetical protein
MFYKRPSRPVRIKPEFSSGLRPQSGRLYDIMNPGECTQFKFVKGPVYMEDHYLRLLKANNKALGIPYVDPVLPKPTPLIPPVAPEEPELDVPDRVYLKLRILKNGTIRVKLSAAIWDLHETYYRNARKPPFKAVLQAYKSHGFSPAFIEQMKQNNTKQLKYAKKLPEIFQKIFDKEPVKKVKKEKKKDIEDVSEEPEEDVNEEEEVPADEGELDVEPDDEEVVEEEEYVSDGDD